MDLEPERERIEQLMGDLLLHIRQELATDPATPNPVNVFVVLNALAMVAAIILGGTGLDPTAVKFFYDSLTAQMADLADGEAGIVGHA